MKLDPLRRIRNGCVPLVRGVCRHCDCLALHQNQTQQKPGNGTVPSVAELCAPFVFRTRGCVTAGQTLQPFTSGSVRCPCQFPRFELEPEFETAMVGTAGLLPSTWTWFQETHFSCVSEVEADLPNWAPEL